MLKISIVYLIKTSYYIAAVAVLIQQLAQTQVPAFRLFKHLQAKIGRLCYRKPIEDK